MDLGLTGKKFVVGGASKGLGRAVAEGLAKEGAQVLLLSRDEQALRKVAAGIGSGASYAVIDIGAADAAEKVAAAVDEKLGGLDGVLVNAGGPPPGEVLALSDEQWAQSFQLLIGGPIRLLRLLVPKMTNGGSVLFITSSSVRQPIPNLDSSNVLRPGVAAMAKTLARTLGPGIRVNTIAPGRFNTDRILQLDKARADAQGITMDEQKEQMSKQIPLGRYGEPEELARLATFLLSPAASYISGVAIGVDGAMVTAIP
jgi:3-oxoacyl-[acyl-carrier protein] reductase